MMIFYGQGSPSNRVASLPNKVVIWS